MKKRKIFFNRKSHLYILNTKELNVLKKLKFLTYKYTYDTGIIESGTIYKNLAPIKKIIFFDTVIKYERDSEYKIKNPFFNIYIPTLFIDYLKYSFKDSLLLRINDINIEDIEFLALDVLKIFKEQNMLYTKEDYLNLMKESNLTNDSSYKDKIKALNTLQAEKKEIVPFYFWLAVLYNVFPFIKFMGESVLETNSNIKGERIFFEHPIRDKKK